MMVDTGRVIDFHVDALQFSTTREVDGASVTLDVESLTCKYNNVEYAVELGSFILIRTPLSNLIATVSSIRLAQVFDKKGKPAEKRVVTCTLVGFLRDGTTFERGIERYPTIACPAYLLTAEALAKMFTPMDKGIPIGQRCQRGGGTEYAAVDRLFGRHTAILGTSGSGKSWTVASLLQSAMRELPHTRIIFLDLHDEYRTAFPEGYQGQGSVSHIRSKDLQLPYWCLTAEELEELFLSKEHAAPNQSAMLRNLIQDLRKRSMPDKDIDIEAASIDTPVYFSFQSLIENLEAQDKERVPGAREGSTKEGPNFGRWSNLIFRLKARRADPRYAFLFANEDPNPEAFSHILGHLLGLNRQTKMTILDLSGLPSEVLSVIVGVLCRLCFDYKYWDTDPNHVPLTLVLEEAHNYLPREHSARERICIERVERIAKEGRKYGVNLMVISQRPSEVNETVLSQCANFVSLRLTNPNDQSYVRRLLPDFLAVAVDMLPYLKTGEAVFSGEAVDIPTRVKIHPPDPTPRSDDVRYLDGWRNGLPKDYDIHEVIHRWRTRQR